MCSVLLTHTPVGPPDRCAPRGPSVCAGRTGRTLRCSQPPGWIRGPRALRGLFSERWAAKFSPVTQPSENRHIHQEQPVPVWDPEIPAEETQNSIFPGRFPPLHLLVLDNWSELYTSLHKRSNQDPPHPATISLGDGMLRLSTGETQEVLEREAAVLTGLPWP